MTRSYRAALAAIAGGAGFARKRVLVTGARGFLGAYFVWALRGFGARVTGLDIKDGDHGDVTRLTSWCDPLDYIIHAAGFASPSHYNADPARTLTDIVAGAENVLRLALTHRARLLLISSSEVYGEPPQIPTPETCLGTVDFRGARACYDVGKRAAEALAAIYFKEHGAQVITVRPFNVYGPGMEIGDSRVLPQFLASAVKGRALKVHNGGDQTRTFCYVSDVVTGMLKALTAGTPGDVYNIGNDTGEISIRALARAVAGDHFGGWSVVLEDTAPPPGYPGIGPARRCPDITKARTELDYNPVVPLNQGISWMIDHYYECYTRTHPLVTI